MPSPGHYGWEAMDQRCYSLLNRARTTFRLVFAEGSDAAGSLLVCSSAPTPAMPRPVSFLLNSAVKLLGNSGFHFSEYQFESPPVLPHQG